MADEPSDENEGSFLEYFERCAPKCKTLKDMIQTEVTAALKANPSPPTNRRSPQAQGLRQRRTWSGKTECFWRAS
jgi:hypothetical protein